MWDTSERLLKLLALLQHQQQWTSRDLCGELGVTARTITRDIARLRSLGYPVTTRKGFAGGYALQAGAVLPPIMFDAREAAAVLLALQKAGSSADGASEHARTALAKLQGAMPSRIRAAAKTLENHTTTIDLGTPIGVPDTDTDTATLLLLSRCCRDRRQLTCTYRRYSGEARARVLEPLHLVHTMGRWYLLAYCTDYEKWAVFRVDRITKARLSPRTSHPRQPPANDLNTYVSQSIARGWQQVTATVRIHAPALQIERWVSPAWGTVTEETKDTCIVEAGADSYDSIARWLLQTKAELTIITPPDLAQSFERIARQSRRTADTSSSIAAPSL